MHSFPNPFMAEWINQVLGLSVKISPTSASFSSIESDSRKCNAVGQYGPLFIALTGENQDGHRFIPMAIGAGARGVILHDSFKIEQLPPEILSKMRTGTLLVFPVQDTLAAYRTLAKEWRSQFSIPVVAIGGSNGKTTTKELLSHLTQKIPHLRTQASENGFIGIPMTLLKMRQSHQLAIVEIGIDDQGAMEQHLEVVQPTHGVLTALGAEHLEKLKTIEIAIEEELKLAKYLLQKNASLAYSGHLKPLCRALPVTPHTWVYTIMGAEIFCTDSIKKAAEHLTLKVVKTNAGGTALVNLNSKHHGQTEFLWSLPGAHHLHNLLAASTLALQLGVKLETIGENASHFQPAYGRSEMKVLHLGDISVSVFADYYNANPLSMTAAILTAKQLANNHRPLYLVLGDMLELGEDELQFHADLADSIQSDTAKAIYLYGKRMQSLAAALKKKSIKVQLFDTHEAIASSLKKDLQEGGKSSPLLLVKGSRGMRMEKVLELLEPKG